MTLNAISSGPAAESSQPHSRAHSRGYRDGQNVQIRASAIRSSDSPRLREAMARLSRLLDQDVPLNRNVPAGFYFNQEV
jgi:hypothetical protein